MADPERRSIVTSGEATVRRVPDLALLSLTVSVRDRATRAARDEANRRTSAILARLAELGIPDADVQAPSLMVQPVYDYSRGSGRLTGYEASRPMSVRIRDVDLLAPVLDSLVDDGATQVHGTTMQLAEPEAAVREALAAAVAVARGRAEALAAAAGLRLGAAERIEEEMGGVPQPFAEMATARMAQADAGVPTEVAPGEIEITARVRAWFAIS
ncbi:MAG TPA: SIMPL domain-containing protein [Candidatus Limnocylindria bacterium]